MTTVHKNKNENRIINHMDQKKNLLALSFGCTKLFNLYAVGEAIVITTAKQENY
jgi:hypothetical protein